MNVSYVKTKNYEQRTMDNEPIKQSQTKGGKCQGQIRAFEPDPPSQSAMAGKSRDSQSSLYYYRARFYSPVLGRFLQPDPVMPYIQYASAGKFDGTKIPGSYLFDSALKNFLQKDPIGRFLAKDPAGRFLISQTLGIRSEISLYTYCGNNPTNCLDPYGLWTWRGVWQTIKDWFHYGPHGYGGPGGAPEAAFTGGTMFYAYTTSLELDPDPKNPDYDKKFKKLCTIAQAGAE